MTGFKQKTAFSKSFNWISYFKNYEIQLKSALSFTYSNLYHYAGNNPVHYIDPTGAFDVDNDNKTITADLNDEKDMKAAANAFFALQDEGFSCKAYDSKTDKSITFNNAKGMYSFLDKTYGQYFNDNSFNFTELVTDMLGLATATAEKGSLADGLNKGLSLMVIASDGEKAVSNFTKGNTIEGINASVDVVIDAIGFAGPTGGYVSVGLKYTKKGFVFGTMQMARAQVELEKYAVNKWTYSIFGVTFK